jgi:hypothetical protein
MTIQMNSAILKTTGGANFYGADGITAGFFRVLNRGGNWNEFYATWQNGWTIVQLPNAIITNVTIPDPVSEPDTIEVTISGGIFTSFATYEFTVANGVSISGGITFN